MSASKSFLRVLSVALALGSICFGQSAATGDLHVIVKDTKGSVITNATVSVNDVAKGFQRLTTANTEGQYNVLALSPGVYTVTVEAQGFAKAVIKDARITVGQLAELPVELGVAGTQETVNVSAEAALVETERTSSTNTIEQRRIENLPINGRNYINFTLTKPVQEAMVKALLATPVRSDVQVPADIAPLVNADPKLVWFPDAEYVASKEREWLDRYTREVQS